MYDLQLFNEIDDIDHLTLAVRRGKPFDRKKAVDFIRRNAARYACVAALNERFDAPGESFAELDDRALYDCLILMRDEMVKHTGIPGF